MQETGRVGLVIVGLGGVGSSLLTGVLAARAHLVHPFGSLAEGGGSGRAPGLGPSPLRAAAPLAELGDLALGAFEVREDDAYRAALRANLVSRSLVDELRPELRKIHAMLGARQAPTRRHLANALAEDLRGFLAHHRCARAVVVCTIPGIRAAPAKQAFTAGQVREALEQSEDWITPGVVYAAAAAGAGCAFVPARQGGGRFRAGPRAARPRRAVSRRTGPRRGAAGGAGCARAEERGPGVDGCALPIPPRLRVAARGADVVAGRPARAAPGRAAGARAQ